MLHISISESALEDGTKGYNVGLTKQLPKKTIHDIDFFPDNSEIEVAVQKLKKLLVQYFNTVDNAPPV